MSELAEKVARVRVRKVQVVVSRKNLVPGVPDSGLWPRVTMELDGAVQKAALTWYAESKKAEGRPDPLARKGIGGEILNICGKASNAALDREDREAMKKAVALARSQITRALLRAARNKGEVGKRVETEQRRALRKDVLRQVREQLQGIARTMRADPELVTPKAVAAVWKDLMAGQIVSAVIES